MRRSIHFYEVLMVKKIEEPWVRKSGAGDEKESASPSSARLETPPALNLAPQPRLVISRGEHKGKGFALEEGENLIGRWDPEKGAFPEIDLEEHDENSKVSRKHAVIHWSDGKVWVEDIGSLNGTFVNQGSRLEPGAKVDLKDGDELVVGKTFLRVVLS